MILLLIVSLLFDCVNCANDFFIEKQIYKNNNSINYYCVTNSSSGLIWIDQSSNEVLQGVSSFISQPRANFQMNSLDVSWKKENSLTGHFHEIIYDRRWEELYLFKTTEKHKDRMLNFIHVTTVEQDEFVIPFSIRNIFDKAFIFLCDNNNVLMWSYCYSLEFDIPSKSVTLRESPGLTSKLLAQEKSDKVISKKWSHFKLWKSDNCLKLLKVSENNETLLIEHIVTDRLHSVHYIFINSLDSTKPVFWKIHEIKYFLTKDIKHETPLGTIANKVSRSICVAMFVSMCHTCYLTLKLKGKHSLETIKQETFKHSIWTEIKLYEKHIDKNELILLISTNNTAENDGFWAFDGIRICQKEELRDISITSNKTLECELINYGHTSVITTNGNVLSIRNKYLLVLNCLVLLLACIIIIILWYRLFYRNSLKSTSCRYFISYKINNEQGTNRANERDKSLQNLYATSNTKLISEGTVDGYEVPINIHQNINTENKMEEKCLNIFSYPVETDIFQEYVNQSIKNGELKRQHSLLTKQSLISIYEPMTEFYEYIDMVFRDGTSISKAYVTTDVPKRKAINNFWSHVFEDNIQCIVILGELEQYWPNENEKITCNGISVLLAYKKNFQFYNYRKFILIDNDIIKHVEQIHCLFSGFDPANLAPFFTRLSMQSLKNMSPILIHSSNDRIGVEFVLVCDMSLRMAKKENTVDVLGIIQKLKPYFPKMLEYDDEYILIHSTISHALFNIQ